ncbi:MAG: ribose-phosphate diphosphokinase [Myxococcota bacterium]
MSGLLLFNTARYEDLASRVAAEGGFERGKVDRHEFPDGEHHRRVASPSRGRDVVLLVGTVGDSDTLEIYDLACTLVHGGAHTLTLVIPWYGYQTMERAVETGEVVVAKTRARLLSSIPIAGSGNRCVLVDLHSEGITQYFSGNIWPVHLYAKPVILPLIRRLGGEDFVLASTDAGRAKWVESLANDLGVSAGFVFKRRLSGGDTEVTALAADVREKCVVIYDDMIRTGGSLIGAAQAFASAGASRIAAVCTHGVFPGDAIERIQGSGLFTELACTDSHVRARSLADSAPGFFSVESIAPLLAERLKQIAPRER